MNPISQMIAAVGPGDTVVVPEGFYSIDAVDDPIWIKKSIVLDLSAAMIVVQPNSVNDKFYFPIGVTDCTDVLIKGGTLRGDWRSHIGPVPDGMGMGHGIVIGEAQSVKLKDVDLSGFLMDGILVTGGANGPSMDVTLDGVRSKNNRRQGLTVTSVERLVVHPNCDFSDNGINGTDPGAGIDFEPDVLVDTVINGAPFKAQHIRDVLVGMSRFTGNKGAGVLVACPPSNRHKIDIMASNTYEGMPIDGTDGIVPFFAKWLKQLGLGPKFNWWGYPRELHLP
jgi:hypothetical protein